MDTKSSSQRKRRLTEGESNSVDETSNNASSQKQEGSSGPEMRPMKKARIDDVDSETKQDQSALAHILKEAEEPPGMAIDTLDHSHQSPFVKLPPDVLFEILVLSGSPEYVLSVMRTCKTMFSILFHSDAQWVWKETRKRVVYNFGPSFPLPSDFSSWGTTSFTLPEPPSAFFRSEVGYASFVFDGGECQVCGKSTSCTFRSYALRFRICKDPGCLRNAHHKLSTQTPDNRIIKLMRYEESPKCFATATTLIVPPLHFRKDQIQPVKDYYYEIISQTDFQTVSAVNHVSSASPLIIFRPQTLAQKQALATEWMQFCTKVYRWREARHIVGKRIREKNRAKAFKYAVLFGWDKSHFPDCPSFQSYSKWKSHVYEELDDRDISRMKGVIESELLASAEKRTRRANEVTMMQNRADIEVLYNSLRSKPSYVIFPPLSAFRKLPVVGILQSTHPAPPKLDVPFFLADEVKKPQRELSKALEGNKMISRMIDTQVNNWVNQAKDDLAVVLGFPKNWKTASSLVLHPVDRLTARWNCTKCRPLNGDGYANKWRMDESLDFEGVCKHECGKDGLNSQGRKSKSHQKIEWSASNFEKDEKVIQVMKKWLEMKGVGEETLESVTLFKHSFAVICKSCDPPMVLDCRNIIAHSHRHVSMDLDANPSIHELNLFLGGFNYTYGNAERLLGPPSHSKTVRAQIEKKIFGCRHCMRKKQVQDMKFVERLNAGGQDPISSESGAVMNTLLSEAVKIKPFEVRLSGDKEVAEPLFSFNGLRSHMKAKHFIPKIHDEDFYLKEHTFMPT